jgi:hypothetical protein
MYGIETNSDAQLQALRIIGSLQLGVRASLSTSKDATDPMISTDSTRMRMIDDIARNELFLGSDSSLAWLDPSSSQRQLPDNMTSADLWKSVLEGHNVHAQGGFPRQTAGCDSLCLSNRSFLSVFDDDKVPGADEATRREVEKTTVAQSRVPQPWPDCSHTKPAREYFKTFGDADIIMGRGGLANKHEANQLYLQEKERMQEFYFGASKYDKTRMAQELVDWVHQGGGRFVKYDKDVSRWFEVDNLTARKRASQALRELNTPEHRAEKRARHRNSLKKTQTPR